MRRAPATFVLILANAVVFLVDLAQKNALYERGAMYGPLVRHGEWYRMFTSAFLHGGFAHIAVNMLSLYYMGTFTEYAMGSFKMLLVYALSIFGSAYAILTFAYMQPTVGASGAIFGLFGALFAIGLRTGSAGRQLIRQAAPILILNLVFTFAVPGISVAGHLGGLITGFIAGLLIYRAPRPVYAHVVDARTGEQLESRIEPQ